MYTYIYGVYKAVYDSCYLFQQKMMCKLLLALVLKMSAWWDLVEKSVHNRNTITAWVSTDKWQIH